MMRLNLIRGGKFSVSEKARDQVFCKTSPIRPFGLVQSPSFPPSLHPRLMEQILGKSPLRLVVSRSLVSKNIWQEILECGHEYTTFTAYIWNAAGCLVEVEITAKRRRCQKCKPPVAAILKTEAEITADQTRAAFVHAQKMKFGTLFDKLCFADGQMRPGPCEKELLEACGKHDPIPQGAALTGVGDPAPASLRKPVQSVRAVDKKRRVA